MEVNVIEIYKITNKINGKVYIGQTIRPVEYRFNRHMNDALNNILDTHFARAIRKYGIGPDIWELQIIDNAQTQEELNQKERYWIKYYNSVEDGYNETDAISKCGGNTYKSKTEEEMQVIKEKLRKSKLGNKNPMAKKIKRINVLTKEEDVFDTVIECAKACGIRNGKTSIVERLSGKRTVPFKKTWIFEYCDK